MWPFDSTPTQSTSFGVGDMSGLAAPGGASAGGLTMGNLATSPATPTGSVLGGVSIGGAGSGLGGSSGALGISGLGANIGTAQLGLQGLNTIGGLWSAYQANQLAQKNFALTSSVANTNLNNSISSYNTNLSDRENTRAKVNGLTAEQANAYIAANQAKRY